METFLKKNQLYAVAPETKKKIGGEESRLAKSFTEWYTAFS